MLVNSVKFNVFMNCWMLLFFTKELLITLLEAADVSTPPAHDPSEPMTPAEAEMFRQHLLANGQWLLGLGKEELKLLGMLTGYNIGGDLLQNTPYVDYIKPDFGSSVNPFQSGYPGAPGNEASGSSYSNGAVDTSPTISPSVIDNSDPSVVHPTLSSDIEPSPQMSSGDINSNLHQDSSNSSYNLTAPFSPSITDPSDEDIVFSPLNTSGDPSTNTASSDNSVLQTGESSDYPPSQSVPDTSSQTVPSGNVGSHTAPTTDVDPLIYPVQFYSQASLSQTKPSSSLPSSGESSNPLANLAEKYPDNFMGW